MPKKEFGFTLIEILISISIITLVGILTMPNLRKFSNRQQIQNSASELENTLKNAQSRSSSNINCSETVASTKWQVIINNPAGASSNYQLKALCDNGTVVSPIQGTFSPNTLISSSTCSSYPVELSFEKNGFSYLCPGQPAPINGDFSITFKDKNGTDQSTVSVSSGGVVSAK